MGEIVTIEEIDADIVLIEEWDSDVVIPGA